MADDRGDMQEPQPDESPAGEQDEGDETGASEYSPELPVLDAEAMSFRQQGGRLQVRLDDEQEWRDASAVRLFPLSESDRWISVVDEEEKEIGLLLELDSLGEEARECVEAELERRYLIPRIVRILSCRQRFDVMEWTVETDRGEVRFLMRDIREKVKRPLPRHVTLEDVEGNRYDIPDVEALDTASRHLLEERV
ncbi:MAG: DUF1854 domain-containing protein [Armatimonadota bacterium]|nr:DUF1854 domain-containing protein [Armatimonadota bacterium]